MNITVQGAARSIFGSTDLTCAQAVHDYENVHLKLKGRLEELLGVPLPNDLKILDLGCGYSYPNVALFNAEGIDVCGADVESVFFRDGRLATFRSRLRSKGFLRALLYAGPRYTHIQRYYSELARLAEVSLVHRVLSLDTYDGCRLPFADGTFSVVCSNAVLQEVDNLSVFVEETARVLRLGGVVDMLWHNFYCPSGGYRTADEVARSPWGHVTGESSGACCLNRKKPDEMRAEFEKRLTVLRVVGAGKDHTLEGDIGFAPEGATELDADWRRKLPGLPEYLLTTRSFLLQAVKDA